MLSHSSQPRSMSDIMSTNILDYSLQLHVNRQSLRKPAGTAKYEMIFYA